MACLGARSATLFRSLAACLCLQACAISSPDTSSPILSPTFEAIGLLPSENQPYLYSKGDSPEDSIFGMSIERCDLTPQYRRAPAWRQLFVGFTDLTVHTHEPFSVEGSPASESIVTGSTEGVPVEVASFTINGECITDHILWAYPGESSSLPSRKIVESADTLKTALVGGRTGVDK